jgi:RND family efflux transporter MFP subunit
MRIILLTILAVTIASCSGGSDAGSPTERLAELRKQREKLDAEIKALEANLPKDPSSMTPVSAQDIVAGPFDHIVSVKGLVDSRSSAAVSAKMGGTIVALAVTNGQAVKKGQLLAQLDDELIRKGIDEVSTQLDFANTVYEKQKRIFEQKAGSEIQYLTAKNTKESLERRMESLKEQLAMTRIVAPVSGIVDGLTPRVGEAVMPGMPMMTIVNMSIVHIIVDLAETYGSRVKTGDMVTVIFPESGDTLVTKVTTMSKSVNPVSRTFRVEIIPAALPASVRPNMTCEVRLRDEVIADAIVIPLNAVMRDGSQNYVWVLSDKGLATRRDIMTGTVSDAQVVVTGGLQQGEKIIVNGALDVAAGQRVRVIQ